MNSLSKSSGCIMRSDPGFLRVGRVATHQLHTRPVAYT
jgi:hypothetical protein